MPFEFIDNNAALSPAARRRIRSHAATGKNAGKTIRRRSKKSALSGRIRTEFRIQDATRLQSDARPDSEVTKELAPKIEGQVGDALSTLFFPVHVPPENRPVVKRGIGPNCPRRARVNSNNEIGRDFFFPRSSLRA